jgi:hypothetical protein
MKIIMTALVKDRNSWKAISATCQFDVELDWIVHNIGDVPYPRAHPTWVTRLEFHDERKSTALVIPVPSEPNWLERLLRLAGAI